MSLNWWERVTESKANKEARELKEREETEVRLLQELAAGDSFKKMVKETAVSLIRETEEAAIRKEQEEAKLHKAKVKKAKEDILTVGQSMQDSNEPFCNVLSMGFDPSQGIKVSLDYNDAFIRYLNAAGIKASNPEETIRLWLANLNYDITQEEIASDYLMNGVSDDEKPSMDYDEMFGMDDEGEPIDNDNGALPEENWDRE